MCAWSNPCGCEIKYRICWGRRWSWMLEFTSSCPLAGSPSYEMHLNLPAGETILHEPNYTNGCLLEHTDYFFTLKKIPWPTRSNLIIAHWESNLTSFGSGDTYPQGNRICQQEIKPTSALMLTLICLLTETLDKLLAEKWFYYLNNTYEIQGLYIV